MVIAKFPPVESADKYGLLAIGGDLEVDSLLLAYKNGIFPWPLAEDGTLAWFSPRKRALLFLERVKFSRSLLKKIKRPEYSFSINTAFREVITNCADQKRPAQRGTWITKDMIDAYCVLHQAGFAHSIECYYYGDSNRELIGGLYGVAIGGMFAGESMFNSIADAGKMSLCYLVDYLRNRGVSWIDCQQLSPLLGQLGAEELPREQFLCLLNEAMRCDVKLFQEHKTSAN